MSSALGCCLFDTAIGACGIAWGEDAIVAVQLPETTRAGTAQRMQRHTGALPEAPTPAWVQDAIARIQALMQGARDDLVDLPLDFSGVPEFHRRVYAIARAIPPAASTRWQGTTGANGLCPSAWPTARDAPGSPSRRATSP